MVIYGQGLRQSAGSAFAQPKVHAVRLEGAVHVGQAAAEVVLVDEFDGSRVDSDLGLHGPTGMAMM